MTPNKLFAVLVILQFVFTVGVFLQGANTEALEKGTGPWQRSLDAETWWRSAWVAGILALAACVFFL